MNFWGVSPSVVRDEEGNCDYVSHGFASSNHSELMGNSWFWNSNDSFDSTPSLLFDLNDNHGMFGKMGASEPVSPSSVDTTPTTSELPMMSTNETSRYDRHYEDCEDDSMHVVSTINVSKRARKSLPSPVHSSNASSSQVDRNGRKKKYDAPPGVWRNSGGFISTVYINKKRVYGPLRRDVNDAVRDREEMLLAKSVIHTEEGMRAFVQGMKERFGADRQSITMNDIEPYSYMSSVAVVQSANRSSSSNSSSTAASAAAARNSSRPVRAAAKRNVFAAFASEDNLMDEADFSSFPVEGFF